MVTRAPNGVQTRTSSYDNFQGLDSTRDQTSLDTGKKQHLSFLVDGYCDWRGQITRGPGATHLYENKTVRHVMFYGTSGLCWAYEEGEKLVLKTDTGVTTSIYALGSILNSTVFNRSAHFFSPGKQSVYFDGSEFRLNQSQDLDNLRPAFATVVGRRLVVAGIPGRETEVDLSRVDDGETFSGDEPIDSTSVLRAGFFDISNVIGRAEAITALGRFEQSKLAVFTSDRCIIYNIDPDISAWALDERASINIGCVSHATVQSAGEDLLFCSRSGVHALRRSSDNGLTITQSSLAEKIDILYRSLLASVPDVTTIQAVWDQDMRQYHVFFPQPGGLLCVRLTITMGGEDPKWSTGTFLQSNCGAAQGGALIFGTPAGVFQVGKIEDEGDAPASTKNGEGAAGLFG